MSIDVLAKTGGGVVNESERMSDNDIEAAVLRRLADNSDGALCLPSSTGEIHGLVARLDKVRRHVGISMCVWGAFVK